jgi:hypothetical protein
MKLLTGEMAGWIWHHLHRNGETSLADLKQHVLNEAGDKFSNLNFFAGLGWLLKEDKLIIRKTDENGSEYDVFVSLKVKC